MRSLEDSPEASASFGKLSLKKKTQASSRSLLGIQDKQEAPGTSGISGLRKVPLGQMKCVRGVPQEKVGGENICI